MKAFSSYFFNAVTHKWIIAKCKGLRVFLFLWFLSRVFFMIFCQMIDAELFLLEEDYFKNSTETPVNVTLESCTQGYFGHFNLRSGNNVLMALIFLHSLTQLVYDTVEYYHLFIRADLRWMGSTPRGRKNPIVHIYFYRISQNTIVYCCVNFFRLPSTQIAYRYFLSSEY